MTVYIGTSGWQYGSWLGPFYPRKPRTADDLAWYADRFQTVELNGTFYKLPDASTFEEWARRTPDDFVFAMKASRFLTHVKRLAEPQEPVTRMLERAAKLGAKLGPVLLQLPPTMKCNVDRLRRVLDVFPRHVRVAVEFRHESWYTEAVRALLGEHDVALCLADRHSRLVTPAWRTASWGYMRFHEGTAAPHPCYGRPALTARAGLLYEMFGPAPDVYVYFNNDTHACALRDGHVFALAARRAGFEVRRAGGRRPDLESCRRCHDELAGERHCDAVHAATGCRGTVLSRWRWTSQYFCNRTPDRLPIVCNPGEGTLAFPRSPRSGGPNVCRARPAAQRQNH